MRQVVVKCEVMFLPVALLISEPVEAQLVQLFVLATPDASSPEPFSSVVGQRGLSNGRIVVTDWIEQSVAIVDLDTGSFIGVGRVGEGPESTKHPAGCFPYRLTPPC